MVEHVVQGRDVPRKRLGPYEDAYILKYSRYDGTRANDSPQGCVPSASVSSLGCFFLSSTLKFAKNLPR